jgi:serine/threonine-protein kinase
VCKLADMGLARLTQDQKGILAEKGRSIGTPYYMSPEQIVGGRVDYRVDIYGLGGTLYHLVTGRMPFVGKTEREIMEKHLREPLVPPDHIRPELSNGLGEVVELMLAKSPRDRYGSVTDLLVDLRAIRRGKPPVIAREKLSQASLEHLAAVEGGPMFPEQSTAVAVPATPAKRSNTVAVIILVILLTLSVILNAFFIIFYV